MKDLHLNGNNTAVCAPVERMIISTEFGRQREEVLCPFCGKKTEAYTWSLAGSGKKCSGCPDTLLTTGLAFKRFKTAGEARKFYAENAEALEK